jgi:hypothetical protein
MEWRAFTYPCILYFLQIVSSSAENWSMPVSCTSCYLRKFCCEVKTFDTINCSGKVSFVRYLESSGMYCRVASRCWQTFQRCVLPLSSGRWLFVWNLGQHLLDYKVVHPRRSWTSYSPPWEPEILMYFVILYSLLTVLFTCCDFRSFLAIYH